VTRAFGLDGHFIDFVDLEAPPGFEPGMEVLQIFVRLLIVLSRAGLWSFQHPRFTRNWGASGLRLDYDTACEGFSSPIPGRRYVHPLGAHQSEGQMHTQSILSELHYEYRLKQLAA
jgi:hypothetical protein